MRSSHPLFVFDLDATITRCELLPLLAREVGLADEMTRQTHRAMAGLADFQEDFPRRAMMLRNLPVSQARAIGAKVPVNGLIADFLKGNTERCLILTGNLDVWIQDLLVRLGMQGRCLCSRGEVYADRLISISHVLDKGEEAARLPRPFVAIGDGDNDLGMIRAADVGIAFSGVRPVSQRLKEAADYVIDDEGELCRFLKTLL